jgi:soluble lytic murein transglycosylase-like protein
MTRLLLPASAIVAAAAAPFPASAQPARARTLERCADHAADAASRARLPVEIVLRVMRAESGGNAVAVSPRGAMGCMQIMPATWTYLTRRYRLGGDPFDSRMNMIGGALYLAELVAEFGMPGAYSAYNAGPGRYRRSVADGVPLPAETVAYTARLAGVAPATAVPVTLRWQEADLFVERTRTVSVGPDRRATAGTDAARARDLFPLAQAQPAPGSVPPD